MQKKKKKKERNSKGMGKWVQICSCWVNLPLKHLIGVVQHSLGWTVMDNLACQTTVKSRLVHSWMKHLNSPLICSDYKWSDNFTTYYQYRIIYQYSFQFLNFWKYIIMSYLLNTYLVPETLLYDYIDSYITLMATPWERLCYCLALF